MRMRRNRGDYVRKLRAGREKRERRGNPILAGRSH